MAKTKLGETTVNTSGNLPAPGESAPDFLLSGPDLRDVALKDFAGKNTILNIFPSVDTSVCATSVRAFNKLASGLANARVICISKDLPFAQQRFCATEGIDKIVMLSDFRNKGFSKSYGIEMIDGVMAGLHARAIFVVDSSGKIKYRQLVNSIGEEPDYDAALAACTSHN